MWWEVGEVAVDLLLPSSHPDAEGIFDKKNPDRLRVRLIEPDGFKTRLNQSGWFDDEVVAAGMLTQGKAQSLLSMITGWALVEMARGKRCKSLSRDICVAVTADRVVVLAVSAVAEGDETTDVIVKVKRGERGAWSRGSVRLDLDNRELKSGVKGGTLNLPGLQPFPVNWDGPSIGGLIELLAR